MLIAFTVEGLRKPVRINPRSITHLESTSETTCSMYADSTGTIKEYKILASEQEVLDYIEREHRRMAGRPSPSRKYT